jgi:hypothetical protein
VQVLLPVIRNYTSSVPAANLFSGAGNIMTVETYIMDWKESQYGLIIIRMVSLSF